MTHVLFEAFVRRYQDMVYATAVRLLGNPAEAEDVAQTAFLKAFQRFDQIGSSPAAAGWLKTVTRNLCLNYLSRYRSRWRLFSEIEPRDGMRAGRDYVETVSAALPVASPMDDAQRHEALEHALARLPDHQRVPLVLYHFEDMSYQDIADALRVSLGKVKTDIHRGREALKALLVHGDASR